MMKGLPETPVIPFPSMSAVGAWTGPALCIVLQETRQLAGKALGECCVPSAHQGPLTSSKPPPAHPSPRAGQIGSHSVRLQRAQGQGLLSHFSWNPWHQPLLLSSTSLPLFFVCPHFPQSSISLLFGYPDLCKLPEIIWRWR